MYNPHDFNEFKKFIAKRRVAVIGIGISNRPLIKLLASLQADVTAFDRRESTDGAIADYRRELVAENISINWSLGEDYLSNLSNFDVIFRTPVMRPDVPEIRAELERGAILTSEMEVFMTYCPSSIIGVTGSDGKSTTSTLIAELLRESGYKTYLGGNIGTPLLDKIEQLTEQDHVVLELSSFQLLTSSISPDIAVVTNITPNHLNVHRDLAEYVEAKEQLLAHQHLTDSSVLFADDKYFSQLNLAAKGRRILFAGHELSYPGLSYYSAEGVLWRSEANEKRQIIRRDQLQLPGDYNVLNFLAALAATDGLLTQEAIEKVASGFSGVPHRVELVAEVDGIKYYNSSIDSSPTRSIATLSIFMNLPGNNILIMGGQDKQCDYSHLGEAVSAASKQLILCGGNADLIKQSIADCRVKIQEVDNYSEALDLARQVAKAGDRIILTPAGTSFDRYDNFEQRGEDFRSLVKEKFVD